MPYTLLVDSSLSHSLIFLLIYFMRRISLCNYFYNVTNDKKWDEIQKRRCSVADEFNKSFDYVYFIRRISLAITFTT